MDYRTRDHEGGFILPHGKTRMKDVDDLWLAIMAYAKALFAFRPSFLFLFLSLFLLDWRALLDLSFVLLMEGSYTANTALHA